MSAASKDQRPNPKQELARLKDFQRRTVDLVFDRLYGAKSTTRRFLVADEVGLGKTLVARGVVVKAIDHLWDSVPRIDIVYLCSNSDIARQNVSRLTPKGVGHVPESPRITLLPLSTHDMGGRKVNVIPLTPGTSLKVAGSLGTKLERALILRMLERPWRLDRTQACRVFCGNAGLRSFRTLVANFDAWYNVDEALADSFVSYLEHVCAEDKAGGRPTIRQRLSRLLSSSEEGGKLSRAHAEEQRNVIGELRQRLGQSCIKSLEPDLIILDEFQRFKDLLAGEGPEAEMAKQLFDYEEGDTKARVLLLSATPYKMFTVADESGGEDHYKDFVVTARFLLQEQPGRADELAQLLREYRSALFQVPQHGVAPLEEIRDRLETILRSVMVRTERLAVTPDRSGMLSERPITDLNLEARDVIGFVEAQRLATELEHPDVLEYWKAAPWLLNFMEGYKLADRFKERVADNAREPDLRAAVKEARHALLAWEDVEAYGRLDPAHGRLRWLLRHVLSSEQWRMLWLPPTMPYYELGPAFQQAASAAPSKALVFSAWRVVPRVVAAVLSYEAERRLYRALEGEEAVLEGIERRLDGLLKVTRREGQVAGLTTLSVLYPCRWLAERCDPLDIVRELRLQGVAQPTSADVIAEAERRIAPVVENLTSGVATRTAPDGSWYWMLPILLDLAEYPDETSEWLTAHAVAQWSEGGKSRQKKRRLVEELDDDEEPGVDDSGAEDHHSWGDLSTRLQAVLAGDRPTGVPPKDVVHCLALVAVGGAATAALRTLTRVLGVTKEGNAVRSAAARIGAGFRTLFNQPDATAAVRLSSPHEDYWKQCLDYSTGLGLQAVLDEYAHLLESELGLQGREEDERADRIAERLATVVGLRRAQIGVQHIHVQGGAVQREGKRFRSRFAMRFGEERRDEATDTSIRADDVRNAFNSPFAPFVLATTSVGQEGLDFHFYCHSVVHWNLPPNPVDLEQREGRVHRFKGLAVRKNLSRQHGAAVVGKDAVDPWAAIFDRAKEERAAFESDLLPYWVYPLENGARIERYVPTLPLSRDVDRFRSLRHALAMYRMVFGQPRQEELVDYLRQVLAPEEVERVRNAVRVSLEPQMTGADES